MGVNVPGLNIFASPYLSEDLFATTGRVFYVGNGTAVPGGVTGVDAAGVGDSPKQPFATWDFAIGQCEASRGDLIIVLPGHAETITTAVALDVAGVRTVGLGWGRLRPTFTASGAIDCVNVSAANCHIHNLRFPGASANVTALINLASGGSDFRATKCVFEQAATPLVAVTVNAARMHFQECQFIGTTGCAADNAFLFETDDCDNWRVLDCVFDYGVAGIDEAIIEASFTTIGGVFANSLVVGIDTLLVDFNSSVSAQGDGIIANIRAVAGAGIADIDTAADVGGYSLIECYLSDTAAESGGRFPLTTPA